MMKAKNWKIDLSKILIIIVLFFLIIMPVLRMLMYIGKLDNFDFFYSKQFSSSLKNSLLVSAVACFIAVFLAFCEAWVVLRSRIRFKGLISTLLITPMLIPSISNSTGLIILLGKNGIINNLFNLDIHIYGFWGIVIGSVLYATPVAYLLFYNILKYENYAPYEAAKILGIPKIHQLKSITVPYLKKSLISIVFATFTIIFTDYGIPLAIGGKFVTLPVLMYQEVIGQLNFAKGSLIGVVLLIPAVIAFIIDRFVDASSNTFNAKKYIVKKNIKRDIFAKIFLGVILACILMIHISFVILAFAKNYPVDMSFTMDNFQKTFSVGGIKYFMNSIKVAVSVALFGIVFNFITAYFTSRLSSKLSSFIHAILIASLAVPGIVLGIAYVLFFKGSIIYGSMIILVMANYVHFSASPYLMMYNTLGKVNENLENVGATLGISRIRMIKDVILPQVSGTLFEMASYLFINSMITISAVSFLATVNTKQFSLLINQFESLMLIECSAVISLMLLLVNILVKGIVSFVRNRVLSEEIVKVN